MCEYQNLNVSVSHFGVAVKSSLVGYNCTLSCWNGHLASLDLLAIHSDNTGSTVTLLAVVGDFNPGRIGHSFDRLTDYGLDSFAIDGYLVIILWSL